MGRQPINGLTSVMGGAFSGFSPPAIEEANISPGGPLDSLQATYGTHTHVFIRTLSETHIQGLVEEMILLAVQVLQYY